MKVNYKQISLSKNRSINRQLKEVICQDLIIKQLKEDAKRLKYYYDNQNDFKVVLN